jgi:hypothetical protein
LTAAVVDTSQWTPALNGFDLEDSVLLFQLTSYQGNNSVAKTFADATEIQWAMYVMNNRIGTITTNGRVLLEGTNSLRVFAEDPLSCPQSLLPVL